jgi:hypothetical protein
MFFCKNFLANYINLIIRELIIHQIQLMRRKNHCVPWSHCESGVIPRIKIGPSRMEGPIALAYTYFFLRLKFRCRAVKASGISIIAMVLSTPGSTGCRPF